MNLHATSAAHISFSKRIVRFIQKYAFQHPLYFCTYIYLYLFDHYRKAFFYGELEVKHCIQEGKSLIRFGDGEINILLGLKNHYQSFSPRLQAMMKEIIVSYTKNSCYILGVPQFVNASNSALRALGKLRVWLPFKVMFRLSFPKHVKYMDAHSFYYDSFFEENIAPLLQGKTIILVTNHRTIKRQQANNRMPWKAMRYVSVLESELLMHYDSVVLSIEEAVRNLNPKDTVVLFAAGPVGKYLAFVYAHRGYQSLDIGKVSEVMFTGESIQYLV